MKYEFNKSRFAELLKEKGLSHTQMIKKLEVSHSAVYSWRTGTIMDTNKLLNICNKLDVKPSEFFLCYGEQLPDDIAHKKADGRLATKKSPAKENDVSDINYINQIKKMEQQMKEKDEIISLQKRLIDGQAELIGIQREFITEQRNDIKDLWD